MSIAKRQSRITPEEYLDGELVSPVKHEYVNGFVYAMVGARNAHNIIAANALVALGSRLRGKKCRPFNTDTKIRLRLPTELRFYYPDLSVVCRPNSQSETFQDEPVVILEVLSRRTRRIDQGEKKEAYLMIPSLSVYMLAEQEMPTVEVWRRTNQGFERELYDGLDAEIPLPEIEASLPLSELYDGIEFSAEPPDEQ